MPNHLKNENSPYLLQHAHNPVDWYPWCDEAIKRARQEDKPIFLSIGYAACHWCHVMERESFEDEATATIMNANFISIKVDREERPDLDSIYMNATQAMTGSGGWPMSVFLTPNLEPFYAGTYFPPTSRYNLPGFKDLLISIARAWREDREKLLRVGNQVRDYLAQSVAASGIIQQNSLTQQILQKITRRLLDTYDWEYGGWGKAPKFPQPVAIEFLLNRSLQDIPGEEEQSKACLKAAKHALQAMAQGGMYDIIGGGFARYSVDNRWFIPHFEKMLYDNAQLALVYLHAFMITKDPGFRQICEATLDFILREMTHPNGGFYSSLDADSEGEEGKFYLWTTGEISQILGPEYDIFKAAYGISLQGNWEGKTILRRTLDPDSLSAQLGLTRQSIESSLNQSHQKLLMVRNTRIHPETDKKILVSWNALALRAFAEAGRYLDRKDYLDMATHNAEFLIGHMLKNDRLSRSWYEGQAKHNAYLEDYSGLVLALLALYQSQFDQQWYKMAIRLADRIVEYFTDPGGGFFDTSSDHEFLLIRPKNMQDNATPSGNALTATAFLQLAAYGDRLEYRNLSEDMLARIIEDASQFPTAFAQWICAVDFALAPVQEVAIIGEWEHPHTKAFLKSIWSAYRPHMVAAVSPYPPAQDSPVLLKDRTEIDNLPTAYVCKNFVCQRPIITPEEMNEQLLTEVNKL